MKTLFSLGSPGTSPATSNLGTPWGGIFSAPASAPLGSPGTSPAPASRSMLLLLLLSVASVLSVRSPGQVILPGPAIRSIQAGSGITVTTNGTSRIIAAPGAAGDITGGAVTGGLLTVAESAGILTYGLTTNSVRSAVSGLYLPLAGGTMTGNLVIANGSISLDDDIDAGGGHITAAQFNGSGAGLTAINASNVSAGTLSRARLPTSQTTPYLHWSSKDCTFHTTHGIWWYPYENTSIDLGAFGLRAAASDDQLGTLRTDWTPVPSEAQAFHETSAITLTFVVSATTGVTEVRGLRLMGRTGIGAPVTLYSDSTTRDGHASVAGGLVSFEIARSSFASTNMVDRIQAEVDVSVEDSEIFAIDGLKVGFQ